MYVKVSFDNSLFVEPLLTYKLIREAIQCSLREKANIYSFENLF